MKPVTHAERTEYLVAALAAEVDTQLNTLFAQVNPRTLYEPARYVLGAGGKRLRPVALLLVAEALGVDRRIAMPAALAAEVFHNFTLVHDDIMDHAAERRGVATVHTRWDESTAILCGDLLMAEAYALLSRLPVDRLPHVLEAFHQTVAWLCEGQALDKEFETRAEVSIDSYEEMIRGKTGALMSFVLEAPALLAGLDGEETSVLRRAGFDIGVGFQVQDDLLDLTATSADWGKAIGGDLVEGKKTYILLRAIESAAADDRRILAAVTANGGLHPSEVTSVIDVIRNTGALDEAAEKVQAHYAAALDSLRVLPENPASEALRGLVERLRNRSH